MHFDGPEFYSYGTVIASIVSNPKGDKAYLVSDESYSITTTRHQHAVRMAIPTDATIFRVPGTLRGYSDLADNERIIRNWFQRIENCLEDAGHSRNPKKDRLIGEAASIAQRMREFAAFFGLGKVSIPEIPANGLQLKVLLERKAEREAEAERKEVARQKRRMAQRKRETALQRDAWLSCASDESYPWSRYHETLLRVVGDTVETSRGASFPVSDAFRGLTLVNAVVANKQEWQSNGHTCRLGEYRIDRIEPNGTVHAGCHVVTLSAIQRIAPALLAANAENVAMDQRLSFDSSLMSRHGHTEVA